MLIQTIFKLFQIQRKKNYFRKKKEEFFQNKIQQV